MNDSLQETIHSIKEVSPFIWEIASKQAYANTVFKSIGAGGFFILFFLSLAAVKFYHKKFKEDMEPTVAGLTVLTSVIAILFLICACAFVSSVIQYYLNPDFYTIQIVLSLIKR